MIAAEMFLQGLVQRFTHKGRFAGTGNTGDNAQAAKRKADRNFFEIVGFSSAQLEKLTTRERTRTVRCAHAHRGLQGARRSATHCWP